MDEVGGVGELERLPADSKGETGDGAKTYERNLLEILAGRDARLEAGTLELAHDVVERQPLAPCSRRAALEIVRGESLGVLQDPAAVDALQGRMKRRHDRRVFGRRDPGDGHPTDKGKS
ncbi:MAG: hypothetical protein R2862_09835 [Thermoanaerobaculia bacterium]